MLRWSALRMAAATRNITTTGQIGDGREAAAVEYVVKNARAGDIDDVLATIDKFAYEKSILINVGDEKGLLLDAAVRRANPALALELGHLLRVWRAAHRQGHALAHGEHPGLKAIRQGEGHDRRLEYVEVVWMPLG